MSAGRIYQTIEATENVQRLSRRGVQPSGWKRETPKGDDIVWSAWEHAGVHKRTGTGVANCVEHNDGAGAEAISEATGMPVEDVKQLIEDERVLYPSIEKFNDEVAKTVDRSKQLTEDVIFTRKGPVKRGMGQWTAPTGTVYTFFESEAPGFLQERGIKASFSPPDMKNYPIQGTGGEVVQMVLGKLFRLHIKKDRYNNRARMVNTVHDCVWFDYRKEVRNDVLNDAIRVMQGIPVFLKKHFDIDCGVVFRVDAEYGPNMYNLHHFDSPYYIK